MFIYQTNLRTEMIEPGNKWPTLYHIISYDLGYTKEEVLSRMIKRDEMDEIYVLKVSEDTLLDEIAHCEELIYYWQTTDEVNAHKSVIIQRQRNLIKHYADMILRSRE